MHHFLSNGQGLELRRAVPDDAPALLAYFRQLLTETDFLLFTREEADRWTEAGERAFIDIFSKEHHLLMLALADGQLVGSLTIRQQPSRKEGHVGQLGIAVLHAYWNMGIGRRLMTAAQRWAEEHNEIEILQLSVVSQNERAIQLYRNFGYVEYGRMPKGIKQPDGSYSDNILMLKRVKP